MEALIPILIQLIGGAAGGNVVGALLKKLPIGKILATVLGAVGGVGAGQLADLLPMLQQVLGEGGGGLLGDAGAGAGGGAILTLIVGLIKKAMAGGAPSGDA
ncbi:hypothetical protein Mal64_04910 [Pseudobythopirellula maris]|uniref:DNA methyltransferase n=1 Tax=Pseudobythopirellula maris TaxID=2527991 RepID=A0A5C5ZSR6_9BACT|nr:hypothetical protein [Pseudobythopirellula maris]TWT90108.1 hypothetical protein Mal64_04910 [Pseudobythopirellula maris]